MDWTTKDPARSNLSFTVCSQTAWWAFHSNLYKISGNYRDISRFPGGPVHRCLLRCKTSHNWDNFWWGQLHCDPSNNVLTIGHGPPTVASGILPWAAIDEHFGDLASLLFTLVLTIPLPWNQVSTNGGWKTLGVYVPWWRQPPMLHICKHIISSLNVQRTWKPRKTAPWRREPAYNGTQ